MRPLSGFSLRPAVIAAALAVLTGTPSVAQSTSVTGGAGGRLIVYFHQEQRDSRQVQLFCRRQIQEEITGHRWGEKFAYDPYTWTPPPPDGQQLPVQPPPEEISYLYQRYPGPGQPYFFADYKGWYRINGLEFGSVASPQVLKSALRTITYNGPPGSYVGPECTARGPTPVMEAWVAATIQAGGETRTLRCDYHDGIWERTGFDVTIVLHGRCTITVTNGGQTRRETAPVREVRKMVQSSTATWGDGEGGIEDDPSGGNCWGGRPGTRFVGPGECPYVVNTEMTHDA